MTHLPEQSSNLLRRARPVDFWEEDDLILTKGKRIYVPSYDNLRREVMKECHDSRWAGHPGVHRTLALVSESYYWPHLKDDVEAFVKTCLVCQQDKIEQRYTRKATRASPHSRKAVGEHLYGLHRGLTHE